MLRKTNVQKCPVCGHLTAIHYVLGSLCSNTECTWVSCNDCGIVFNRDGRMRRAASKVQ